MSAVQVSPKQDVCTTALHAHQCWDAGVTDLEDSKTSDALQNRSALSVSEAKRYANRDATYPNMFEEEMAMTDIGFDSGYGHEDDLIAASPRTDSTRSSEIQNAYSYVSYLQSYLNSLGVKVSDFASTIASPKRKSSIRETPAEISPELVEFLLLFAPSSAKVADKTEEAPVKESPLKETPVTESPVKESPVKETPVTESPVKETPVKESLVNSSGEVSPARESPESSDIECCAPVNTVERKSNASDTASTGLESVSLSDVNSTEYSEPEAKASKKISFGKKVSSFFSKKRKNSKVSA
jgi:hypothetical protein